jgi:hypothetical protein
MTEETLLQEALPRHLRTSVLPCPTDLREQPTFGNLLRPHRPRLR